MNTNTEFEEEIRSGKKQLKYRTIILSDIHLGTSDCKIDQVNHFIRHTWSEKLILNGDIIDGWSLKRKKGWKKKHTYFVRRVLKIAEKKGTKVIYLAGNHDEISKSGMADVLEEMISANTNFNKVFHDKVMENNHEDTPQIVVRKAELSKQITLFLNHVELLEEDKFGGVAELVDRINDVITGIMDEAKART